MKSTPELFKHVSSRLCLDSQNLLGVWQQLTQVLDVKVWHKLPIFLLVRFFPVVDVRQGIDSGPDVEGCQSTIFAEQNVGAAPETIEME